jgi:hypothetical protein
MILAPLEFNYKQGEQSFVISHWLLILLGASHSFLTLSFYLVVSFLSPNHPCLMAWT